jgi:hypothetical protein
VNEEREVDSDERAEVEVEAGVLISLVQGFNPQSERQGS